MESKYSKKEMGPTNPSIQRKPLPKEKEASDESLYHIAIAIVCGLLLCLVVATLDYVSQETTPTTETTDTIEYFE